MGKREELIDWIPMNWGKNLTLLGAIRVTGWVMLTSMLATANKDRFVAWVKRKLLQPPGSLVANLRIGRSQGVLGHRAKQFGV